MAGLAAAEAGNGVGVEGVSPNSKTLAIKIGGSGGATDFDMAQGLAYARTVSTNPQTKVINGSFAFINPPGSYPQAIADEVAAIKAAGKVFAASATDFGNTDPFYPAADPNTTLRVMGTTWQDCRTGSNFSPASNPTLYNIAAPGRDLLSTGLNNDYTVFENTSAATAVVSGAAALVWGQSPSLTREQLVDKLTSTGEKTNCGFAVSTPRVDVRKAIRGTSETSLTGVLFDPVTGTAPSPATTPVTAKLFSGTTLLKSDATNESGSYEMTGLATGTGRTLKATRSGYVSATVRKSIAITSEQVAGPFVDALPRARPTGNVTVTIDWKTREPRVESTGCVDTCLGWELDLTAKLPNGTYVDPVVNKGSLAVTPFVKIPRNSLDDAKPLEGLVIGRRAANGIYRIFIRRPANAADTQFNPSWSGSQASVQMYNGATSIGGGLKVVPSTCGTKQFWYVGDLTKSGTSYTFTNKNRCTNTAP